MSDATAHVADATGNWVDTRAPSWSRPYLRLSRFDRPIGSWLLLMPCWWPQVVLGLAFSWGALMGFAVTLGRIDLTALVLYAGSIAWVIGYDTIYAHQDAEDDALIGIKSTARLFGARTHRALTIFYALAVIFIGVALVLGGARWPAWIGLVAFAAHLVWQIRRLDISDPALCLRVFKSNRDAGLLLFAGLLADAVMRANS